MKTRVYHPLPHRKSKRLLIVPTKLQFASVLMMMMLLSSLSRRCSLVSWSQPTIESSINPQPREREIPLSLRTSSDDSNRSFRYKTFWLQPYLEFAHERSLVPHPRGKRILNESIPYLQWACNPAAECGGLGDRIYGIVQSFLIAVCTDRVFLLESQPNDDDNNNRNSHQLLFQYWHLDRLPRKAPGYLVNSRDNRNHVSLHQPDLLPPGNILMYNNLYMGEEVVQNMTCWKNKSTRPSSPIFSTAFSALFQWSPLVLERATHLQEKLGLRRVSVHSDDDNHTNGRAPYIAMHVRAGGKGSSWQDPLRHASHEDWNAFYECSKRLQKAMAEMLGNKMVVPIYVAADNANVKQYMTRQFVDPTIRTSLDLEVYHIDKSAMEKVQNPFEAELNVYSELRILMEATCLVMSYSKFSHLAADIASNPCALHFDACTDLDAMRAVASLRIDF